MKANKTKKVKAKKTVLHEKNKIIQRHNHAVRTLKRVLSSITVDEHQNEHVKLLIRISILFQNISKDVCK
jgi:hypothetical protein